MPVPTPPSYSEGCIRFDENADYRTFDPFLDACYRYLPDYSYFSSGSDTFTLAILDSYIHVLVKRTLGDIPVTVFLHFSHIPTDIFPEYKFSRSFILFGGVCRLNFFYVRVKFAENHVEKQYFCCLTGRLHHTSHSSQRVRLNFQLGQILILHCYLGPVPQCISSLTGPSIQERIDFFRFAFG